jgi:hypothetical protein
MVKKNKKIEHIYNNTYRAGAYYLFNYNIDEANKLLSRRGIDMKLPDSVGLATTYSTDKNIVVCYWDTDRPISEVFSIAVYMRPYFKLHPSPLPVWLIKHYLKLQK